MRTLASRAVLLLLVMIAVGGVCGLFALTTGKASDLQAVVAATGAALPAAIFTLILLSRYGIGPGGIIAATFVRFGLTVGLASYVAWEFSSLRTLPFFITVTVVYLAGLFVETWLVWKDFQRSGSQPES